jgi:hypothetical protein
MDSSSLIVGRQTTRHWSFHRAGCAVPPGRQPGQRPPAPRGGRFATTARAAAALCAGGCGRAHRRGSREARDRCQLSCRLGGQGGQAVVTRLQALAHPPAARASLYRNPDERLGLPGARATSKVYEDPRHVEPLWSTYGIHMARKTVRIESLTRPAKGQRAEPFNRKWYSGAGRPLHSPARSGGADLPVRPAAAARPRAGRTASAARRGRRGRRGPAPGRAARGS